MNVKMEEENKKSNPEEDITNPYRHKLWYSERYRQRYNEKYGKKHPPEQNKIITEIAKEEKALEKEIKKDIGGIIDYAKEPKHIKIIKIFAILAVIGIIGYLLYANFIISQDFNYFYDIGSEQDAKKPYLTPISRVSDIVNENREMTDGLVYFTANIPRGSETISVQARFKDNFPNNSLMSIGASDNSTAWHYKYNLIFSTSNTTGQWLIGSTTFNIKQDKLSIKNNQLSILFNMPHFSKGFKNNTIPIDWINITVHKPGLIEKWRGN